MSALNASGWLVALMTAVGWRVMLTRRMELVARACHELRGPLTAARLAAQLAGRGLGVSRSVRGPLEAIDLELSRARLALDDLAAAQHGGRAEERASTFDIGVLLVDVAEAWRAFAATHDVRIRLEQPPGRVLVSGDRTRLAQACGNLLANAIEHGSPAGSEVVVRARAGVHTARIEVLDEGPGLPAPVAELVRRPRGGRGTRGRGLAIAADVAARHRGRLAAAPCDQGARLVLELPTAVAS
ncbi:MAG TPA: HAMP domain-containing sensor histidine kinase [Conexibacter sp.]|jgi:signal transduction histidine kinase